MSSQPSQLRPPPDWPADPLRLLLGIRHRWKWFLILPAAGLLLGAVAGWRLAENRYSVSLQLIKLEVPSAVQASGEGQPFRPRLLSDDTLLATTYATEVLAGAAGRLSPPRSGGELKSQVQIQKQRNTDFFYLTAHSRRSRQDALDMVREWAAAIIDFTRQLQRREAIEMRTFLDGQMSQLQGELEAVNGRIIAFSNQEGYFGGASEVDDVLKEAGDEEKRLTETRLRAEVKRVQLERYENELRGQSPLRAEIHRRREELATLLGRYTRENPLVEAKEMEIAILEAKAGGESDTAAELRNFTGTDLGNSLYLEVLALQAEYEELKGLVQQLEQRLAQKRSALQSLPARQMAHGELSHRREELLTATTFLAGRLKEAEFYAGHAPGYWRVFQEPQLGDVQASSRRTKILGLSLLAAAAGFLAALLLALLWELAQPGTRTALGAVMAARAWPAALLNGPSEAARPSWTLRRLGLARPPDPRAEARRFWLQHAARSGPPASWFLFATAGRVEPADEALWWQSFLAALLDDGGRFCLVDLAGPDLALGPQPWQDASAGGPLNEAACHYRLPPGQEPPPPARVEEWRRTHHVFYRYSGPPSARVFAALRPVEAYFLINSPHLSRRVEVREAAAVYRRLLGPARGLVLLQPPICQTVPWAIDRLEKSFFGTGSPSHDSPPRAV